jgi:predicted nucleic acid-binding protein
MGGNRPARSFYLRCHRCGIHRWQNYWDSFISMLESVPLDHQVCERAGELLANARRAGKTVPLGDGRHGAVAGLEDLTVATMGVDHFEALGVRAINPLK